MRLEDKIKDAMSDTDYPIVHHYPTLPYSGLSIILEKPSRHDTRQLISGQAGQFFESCLLPISRFSCDIMTAEEYSKTGLLPNTKLAFHLGEESLKLLKPEAALNEERGSPFSINEIIRICSYAPQDTFDRRNYEKPDEPDEDTETGSEKGHQVTKRRNHRFWLHSDTRKAVRILRGGKIQYPNFNRKIYSSSEEIIRILRSTTGVFLFIDIETDKDLNLTCFGFSFVSDIENILVGHPVYVVPIKRCWSKLAYDELAICKIIQALCIAMHNNTCVLHNACFDLFVLAFKYKIPFPKKIFCTMLGWNRLHPEVEKSLGHLISYYTDLPFHKNSGVFDPKNQQQEQQLWLYNSNDISSLILVFQKLVQDIPKVKAIESVEQVMASIRPYLIIMFNGLKIDEKKFLARFAELEFRREQLGRCLKIITRKEKFNPRSPQQVAKYLYAELGLPMPDKDITNEKTLLKLLTKNNVPSIKLILDYRGTGKLASSLKFRMWQR